MVDCQCLQCNKQFKCKKSRILQGRGKYCSRKCKDVALIGTKRPPFSKEWKDRIRQSNLGQKRSKETRKKLSEQKKSNPVRFWLGKKREDISGDKSHLWKGGVSQMNRTARQQDMQTTKYKQWRRTVFERDNFTCQECQIHGAKLHADHIQSYALFPQLRYSIDNGRTLCVPCHMQTETWGRGAL